jgi:hypothetical protein
MKKKEVCFTIFDILTEFKIPYQAICQTEGTHFQSFGQMTGLTHMVNTFLFLFCTYQPVSLKQH